MQKISIRIQSASLGNLYSSFFPLFSHMLLYISTSLGVILVSQICIYTSSSNKNWVNYFV